MPCNSDYMEPTRKEALLQQTAKLYQYVLETLGLPCDLKVNAAAQDIYCKDDYVLPLCGLLRELKSQDESQGLANFETVVYNARCKTSRELATWWEEHCEADAKREAEEAKSLTLAQKLKRTFDLKESTESKKVKDFKEKELIDLGKDFHAQDAFFKELANLLDPENSAKIPSWISIRKTKQGDVAVEIHLQIDKLAFQNYRLGRLEQYGITHVVDTLNTLAKVSNAARDPIQKVLWESLWKRAEEFCKESGFSSLGITSSYDGGGIESWPVLQFKL